ncbi:armadillo-type protein [Cantharellus anzutake]|uniref:armadillo-type protein n=1 Tax=Cantharellus anzutake TaxID=1750568 RepID=UPI0019083E13|nr:armadillo-type protein [Cantharellus anzutake]KAF8341434.1 armadillo-type protein [Cantharellus anzutake]
MRDFGEVLAALRYPHEIRAPIFGHAFARIADDASWRKDMISAGFVHSFTQALSQDPLPEKDVLEFLARCVEVASIEIGRSGHTPDILKMCSHQDPTISMAVLNGLASISVNGTPDDRVRLIQDGFLEESLHFCSQDSLSPGVLSLLQQSVPALSHAILNESRVSTFLIPALCNKHEPVWELSYSALHDILSSGDDSSDMMRAQIWPTISHSPLVVCNFIEQALHLRWANDLSNARSVHLLYELLPHTHLGIRTEAMRQLAEIATLEDFQEALVDTGVFEVLLTLIGDSRQDVRLSSNNLLPVLGIAFAQGGKLSVLQKLLFSSDSLISSSTYSAIRTILETGEEKHYWKLIESGLVPDLLSGTTAKPSEKLVILLDMSLNKLGSFLLLNGSGNILFEVLESNRAPRLQATSEEVLKALANGTPRHRRLVWDLLLPRLKSKPERLCMAASAMLSHRLAADRVDSKEYVVMYELLGHPHPAIRKPIMDEFGQLITGENIDIRANEIIVDLLNVLLQLTSSTTAFPDVVSFTGEIFLPKTGLALWYVCGRTDIYCVD